MTCRLGEKTDDAQIVGAIEAVGAKAPDRARALARLSNMTRALGTGASAPAAGSVEAERLRESFRLASSVRATDRRRAAWLLAGAAGCRAAHHRLARMAVEDQDHLAMISAVEALAAVSGARLVRVVRQLARGDDRARLHAAVVALAAIDHAPLLRVLPALAPVRRRVMREFAEIDPVAAVNACSGLVVPESSSRRAGVALLEELVGQLQRRAGRSRRGDPREPARQQGLRRLSGFAQTPVAEAGEALRTLERLGWKPLAGLCRRLLVMLGTSPVAVREACRILGAMGGPCDRPALVRALDHDDAGVRRAAIDAMIALHPDEAADHLARLLLDRDRANAAAALERLQVRLGPRRLAGLLLDRLPRIRDAGVARRAFTLVLAARPDRLERLVGAVMVRRDDLLLRGLDCLEARLGAEAPEACGRLALGHLDAVAAACRRCARPSPARRRSGRTAPGFMGPGESRRLGTTTVSMAVVVDWLASRGERGVRALLPIVERQLSMPWTTGLRGIIDILGSIRDDRATRLLVIAVQHADSEVRQRAVRHLAGRDDPEAFAALVLAADDPDGAVLGEARHNLLRHPCPRAVRETWPDDGSDRPVWEQMRAAIARCDAWAEEIGAWLLDARTVVHRCRSGLGATSPPSPGGPVVIEVSAWPIASAHPRGEEVVRALSLHELGHHFADFSSPSMKPVQRTAVAEGLGGVLNLVLDERLERQLRSIRPAWGRMLDRLAAYAFSRNERTIPIAEYAALCGVREDEALAALRAGDRPGRLVGGAAGPTVALRDIDLFRTPGALPPLAAFAACLRGGLDPVEHPDSRVARAMALVPADLRRRRHHEVLDLCRRLVRVLGGLEACRREARRLRDSMRRHRAVRHAIEPLLRRLSRGEGGELLGTSRDGLVTMSASPGLLERDGSASSLAVAIRGGIMANHGNAKSFPPLARERVVRFDAAAHEQVLEEIRPQVRRLRRSLVRLGTRAVDEHGSRRGRRLDLARARTAVVRPEPGILVHRREEILADAYLGILIDRSGSMQGEKMLLARSFGVLLAEAARGIRGLEGHVSAFDDDTFYPLGNFRRCAAASVTAGGGNNDAGGLARAAALAEASCKRNRLIVMISDGLPTDCTVEALRALVGDLVERRGILAAQVVVGGEAASTFPHHLDLTDHSRADAVDRFGRLLVELTRPWRGRGAW